MSETRRYDGNVIMGAEAVTTMVVYKKGGDTPPLDGSDFVKLDTRQEGSVFVPAMREDSSYKSLDRWQASLIYMTNQIGVGIFSLQTSMQTLSLIPCIIGIIVIGILVTYNAYVLLQLFRRYLTVPYCGDCFKKTLQDGLQLGPPLVPKHD
ncbi:hypothetical protein T440DRAFT_520474 [Plenodomus tracheiphilus IPT5]|uniref:Amino acid transporter transmembrane domain-containing protein n=1 Tax=Plenodomus tracheiphilus IPT5 TaxID=1408161 RepID=A0A6A7AXM0_9PLEO|nr:hypothetical protein T440DRAFT_520474 [Plenodomus tracheiphilus IPT5]